LFDPKNWFKNLFLKSLEEIHLKLFDASHLACAARANWGINTSYKELSAWIYDR